jgi:hypothetical protein
MRLAAACVVALLAKGSVASAETVRWGGVHDGLRLGIRAAQTDDRPLALEVVLENQGPQQRAVEFPDVGAGLVHSLHFEAVRNREVLTVFDTSTLKLLPSSLVRSAIILLAPGGRRTFVIPIDRLICVIDHRDTPLHSVLSAGYSVRAEISLPAVNLSTPLIEPTTAEQRDKSN